MPAERALGLAFLAIGEFLVVSVQRAIYPTAAGVSRTRDARHLLRALSVAFL